MGLEVRRKMLPKEVAHQGLGLLLSRIKRHGPIRPARIGPLEVERDQRQCLLPSLGRDSTVLSWPQPMEGLSSWEAEIRWSLMSLQLLALEPITFQRRRLKSEGKSISLKRWILMKNRNKMSTQMKKTCLHVHTILLDTWKLKQTMVILWEWRLNKI